MLKLALQIAFNSDFAKIKPIMKEFLLFLFISLLFIISGLGFNAIVLEKSQKDLSFVESTKPTSIPPNISNTDVQGVQYGQNDDPYINCETKSKGSVRMRKSECLGSVDCLVDGKYYLTKNNDECQTLVMNKQKQEKIANPTETVYKYNFNTQTTYAPCIVYYRALRYSVTYPNTSPETCKLWQNTANVSGITLSPTTRPPIVNNVYSPQSVGDCLYKFAALGSLDSSEAQKCYTDPGSVPPATDDCFKTWEDYFAAHPGYVGNVSGLGSSPPCR